MNRFLAAAFCVVLAAPALAEEGRVIPAPADDPAPASAGLQKLVVAGGCFWGVQGVYQHVAGVERAVAGYAGGQKATAHYEVVSGGHSGHAEAVEITYDPKTVSLGKLLHVFFSAAHDPTQLNAQGPDAGTQYRSAIFIAGDAQERVARDYVAQLEAAHVFPAPIVTRLERLSQFYPAEAYHQDYLIHHPESRYIQINDLPKIESLKRLLPSLYRAEPKLVGG